MLFSEGLEFNNRPSGLAATKSCLRSISWLVVVGIRVIWLIDGMYPQSRKNIGLWTVWVCNIYGIVRVCSRYFTTDDALGRVDSCFLATTFHPKLFFICIIQFMPQWR